MNETTPWTADPDPAALSREITSLHEKLDRVIAAVDVLDRHREDAEEMLADLLPAANGAVRVATDQLWRLERQGTLGLAQESFEALLHASRTIDPGDVRALGENAGPAVRALRELSGPDVTSAAGRTVDALRSARLGKPPGFFALLRRMRQPHVRRGLWAVLQILDGLGEGAHHLPGNGSHGPRTPQPRTAAAPPSPSTPAAPSPGLTSAPAAGHPPLSVDGVEVLLDADGFLQDAEQWTPAVAEALAARLGLEPLTPEHLRVLEFCRADAGASGGAPGLRRITKELEIPPADMYRLFPKGPGTLAARLAGLTKPKSCV